MTGKDYLTIREVAARSGLSRAFLYRLVESRSLTVFKPSRRRIMVRWEDFEAYIAVFRQQGMVRDSRHQRRRPVPAAHDGQPDLLPFASDGTRE